MIEHRRSEARVIETKFPAWMVPYGVHSREFRAFGAAEGLPFRNRPVIPGIEASGPA